MKNPPPGLKGAASRFMLHAIKYFDLRRSRGQPTGIQKMNMRVVSTTRILDEADLVEAFVRHTSEYVDHLIFLDNGSSDGTLEILQNLKNEGFSLEVFSNRAVFFTEEHFNTFMYLSAVQKHGADWVLCLDCDEFIDDRAVPGGLRSVLEKCSTGSNTISAIQIPLADYAITAECNLDEINVPKRMIYRGNITNNTKVFLNKSLLGPDLTVGGGNHEAYVKGVKVASIPVEGLHLAHFPSRTVYQFSAKYVKGWAKVLAAGAPVVNRGTSAHYKDVFHIIKNNPSSLLAYPQGNPLFTPVENLIQDPIDYRGSELKYTSKTDDVWRCLRAMTGYLEDLAMRHGQLITECDDARKKSAELNGDISKIIG